MTYQAIVCSLKNVRTFPGADRLKLADASNCQVIVSLDNHEDQLGVLFLDDGVLSQEMAYENNLFSKAELNKDPTKKPGYFSPTPRIKAQKLRGEKSYGFWTELSSLAWTGADLAKLKDGDAFSELNGRKICEKYINQATRNAASQGKSNKDKAAEILARRIKSKFSSLKEHFDTPQLRKDINSIPIGATLYLTNKVHGTSGRTGNVLVERHLIPIPDLSYNRFMWLNWLLSKLPFGARRAKLFVRQVLSYIQLAVVWLLDRVNSWFPLEPTYQLITGTRRTVLRPDDEIDKGYYSGKTFRIDIHKRLKKLGIPYGYTVYYEPDLVGPITYDGDKQKLIDLCESFLDQPDSIDPKHIREGVCVRAQTTDWMMIYKIKSFIFLLLESAAKSNPNTIDVEEVEALKVESPQES